MLGEMLLQLLAQALQRLFRLMIDRNSGDALGGKLLWAGLRFIGGNERANARAPFKFAMQLIDGEEQLVRRQQWPLLIIAPLFIALR